MTTGEAARVFLRERGLADEVVEAGTEGLIARWEQAARETERERYPFGIEDWLNELDGRQLIAELAAAVPGAVAGAQAARLDEADRRLRAATEMAGACVWGEALATRMRWQPATQWWYWRLPRVVDDDFS
ncbi:MAG TPA: hypothetical protein VMH61_02645 [Candidatus Acidoferrales bacterium]|nr:hypothetical protein [Candidatus Acidoferrales bacterium]